MLNGLSLSNVIFTALKHVLDKRVYYFFDVSGNDNHRVDNIVEEAEGLLRSSYELEKAGDLALSLSMSTNASSKSV